jgi:hypothetical protein
MGKKRKRRRRRRKKENPKAGNQKETCGSRTGKKGIRTPDV